VDVISLFFFSPIGGIGLDAVFALLSFLLFLFFYFILLTVLLLLLIIIMIGVAFTCLPNLVKSHQLTLAAPSFS
jgi:hypothetical protein